MLYTINAISLYVTIPVQWKFNTLRPRQNGRHFADNTFWCIFLNENVCISINNSLKIVPRVRIDKIPASVQIMAWRQPGDKPLSESMMVSVLTHICIIRPRWVNQQRGYWLPGALAPRHQYPQNWISVHTFPAVYGLITDTVTIVLDSTKQILAWK